jgi:hypothetical protein
VKKLPALAGIREKWNREEQNAAEGRGLEVLVRDPANKHSKKVLRRRDFYGRRGL